MSYSSGVAGQSGETEVVSTKTPLTPSAPGYATVGVTSAQVIGSNANRKGLVLINDSANKIYLGLGSNAAVLGSGIVIYPSGGVYDMSEYDYVTSAVNAISGVGSSNLTIQEFQ